MLKYPRTCLGVYAGILTLAFAALVLMGAGYGGNARFNTIDVNRINVREPDGTLRMVISNRSSFPGWIIHGKEYPHKRPYAGMLFYNDEGTEDGGLVFNGKKSPDGNVSSGLSLTFDRYDQDQQLQLIGTDQDGHAVAGMQVNDVPDRPIAQSIEEKSKLAAMPKEAYQALMEKREKEHYYGAPRYYAGKSGSGNSVVMLNDASGNPRLLLMVTKKGTASIEFLGADGKVQRTLTANDPAGK